MFKKSILGLTIVFGLANPAISDGISFIHNDWEVSCDNTLTCRIAGYGAEEEVAAGSAGSVLFTRLAGENTAVTGEVMFAEMDEDVELPTKLMLWIDGKSYGILPFNKGVWLLSNKQSLAVIEAINGTGLVEFKEGDKRLVLSNSGSTAVFVKADDAQGRINTPGALVKRGDKPESSVHKPVPLPVIYKVKTSKGETRSLSEEEEDIIRPKLMATVSEDSCERIFPDGDPDGVMGSLDLTPLDKKHSLLSAVCWRAAYNEGVGFWVVDNELKTDPVLVTESGTDYEDGTIFTGHKGRGIGDCWSIKRWVWDGKEFKKSTEYWTGMCRYLRLGGTWELSTFVSEVKQIK